MAKQNNLGSSNLDGAPPTAQINMGGEVMPKNAKAKESEQEGNGGGNLQGKAPETFDGDKGKSKAFLSNLRIYFKLNRKKEDIQNYYSRVLLALSFIKGPNMVDWVNSQYEQLAKDLKYTEWHGAA